MGGLDLTGTRFEGAFDYAGHTEIHPVALSALILLGFLLLSLPRRYAALPLMVLVCFVSARQRVVLFTLDFNFVRLLVIIGWARLLMRRECRSFRWHRVDKLMVAWAVSSTVTYTLLYRGAAWAFVFQLGTNFEALGLYFLFRNLVKDWRDVERIAIGFTALSVPVLAAFLIEHSTGRNVFSLFGGVPEFTFVRQGRLRCQGAFDHPILAGCFWAAQVPLYAARWWSGPGGGVQAVVGVGLACALVVLCASSTPVLAVLACVLGGAMFFARHHLRMVRRSTVAMLVFLHLIMKAPVWHLISRIDLSGGSTGYHRFALTDAFIRHFREWVLFGVRGTAHWGWGLEDVTNQFILEGTRGGIVTLVLFVWVIAACFHCVGETWRAVESDRRKVALSWALGVVLFAHCVSFNGVSYFGQIYVIWYMVLGMIVSIRFRALDEARAGGGLVAENEVEAPRELPRHGYALRRPRAGAAVSGRRGW